MSQTIASNPNHQQTPTLHDPDPKRILGSGQLHPEMDRRVTQLVENARAEGMDVYIFEGKRSPQRQAQLKSQGNNVTNAGPGRSFHQYGMAVDVVFHDPKGNPSWDSRNNWQELGRLGKDAGLRWGGDWKRRDYGHFELPTSMSSKEIKALCDKIGLEQLWKEVR